MKSIINIISRIITGPRFAFGGDAPKAPDPYKTAAAQLQATKDFANFDAYLNRFKQTNPFGQVDWKNTGTADNPSWAQTTTLSPEQQSIYNSQLGTRQALAGQAQDYTGRLASILSGDPTGGDLATRKRVESGLMERLDPFLTRDEDALRTRLANQGLTYGSEAYGNAMEDMNKRVNDARLAVIGEAGNEMQRQQQMDNMRRNQGIAELSSLMQGTGSINVPGYSGATSVNAGSAPDIAGMIYKNYENELANYNAEQAGKNDLLGTLVGSGAMLAGGGLGGAFGGALGGASAGRGFTGSVNFPSNFLKF